MTRAAGPIPRAARELLRNSGSALLLAAAQAGSRFAGALLIAHHLGAREFGLFAVVWAHLELFRVVADFGLEPVLVRRVALAPATWPGLARRAVALKLALAAGAAVLAVALGGVWGYGDRFHGLLLLALPSLFLIAVTNALSVPYVAGLALHRIAWVGAASGALYLAAVATAGALGGELPAFVLCAVAHDAVNAAGVLAVGRGGRAGGGAPPPRAAELLREARAPALTSFLVTAYVRIGLLLVGAWTDMRTAGNLALATRLAEVFKLVSGAVATSTFPVFARLAQADRRADAARLFGGLGAVLTGAMLAAALLAPYGLTPLLAAVFPRYEELPALVVPLLWSMVFVFANMHASSLLSGFGRFWLITAAAAVNIAVSLAANTALIPRYGGLGAAWAYLLTEAVNSALQLSAVAAVLGRMRPARVRGGDVRGPV